MPFALDGGASNSEIVEAINYVLANLSQTTATNPVNGQITDATGQIVGYLYKYIFVKYADSFDGTVNFSNSPTNRGYYGIRNSDSSTESTNPADYVWTQVTGGFGTTKFLWYLTIGGRQIQWQVATTVPNPGWAQDPGTAIDLDIILGATKNPSNYIVNRVPNNNAAPTDAEVVSAIGRYPISGDLCTVVYNNGQNSTLWRYTTGWAIYIKYITGDIISTNSVLTNTLQVGSTPAISGSTMTGSGAVINSNGTFALGNSSSNIVFNGTNAYINGFTSTTGGGTSNLYIANGADLFSFTISTAGNVMFGFSCTYSATVAQSTGAIYTQSNVSVELKNSSGTVVWSTVRGVWVALSLIGTNFNVAVPMSATMVKNLTPDTYTLRLTGPAYFTNSSGNSVTLSASTPGSAVDATYFYYQIKV